MRLSFYLKRNEEPVDKIDKLVRVQRNRRSTRRDARDFNRLNGLLRCRAGILCESFSILEKSNNANLSRSRCGIIECRNTQYKQIRSAFSLRNNFPLYWKDPRGLGEIDLTCVRYREGKYRSDTNTRRERGRKKLPLIVPVSILRWTATDTNSLKSYLT